MTKPIKSEDREALLEWGHRLAATSNKVFLPLFFNESRYLILMGGGGSGKSIFAGRKLIERCICEPGHRFLVVRKVAKALEESCVRQLLSQAEQTYPTLLQGYNKTTRTITFRNGSAILFSGLDDVEKLKSIYGITGIWIEEASELTEEDFNQLDIRLRDKTKFYKQIIASFNPISVSHWLKKRFFDRRDDRATLSVTTYRDNRFLSADAVATLEGFRESDPYYYQVYCLGQWGVTGKTVFSAEGLAKRRAALSPPLKTGRFLTDTQGIFVKDFAFSPGGDAIRIYREPLPGHPYLIGGDTAGEGSDFFTGQVLDNVTGEQVAVLRFQYDEDEYCRQMWCLGKYYNDALLCIETNYSTYPNKLLQHMGYPRLYVRESFDTFAETPQNAYGFDTNARTRPVILAELIRVMRGGEYLLNDEGTVDEMLTFVKNERLRPEAERGCHDDLVMALAIAHYCRPKQRMHVQTDTAGSFPQEHWSPDILEDYCRASPALQKIMKEHLKL